MVVPGDAARVWHFDGRRLGREIRSRREAAGHSTRHLARLAAVSQAYVVALERSASSRDPSGPCPTVEVLARLASALGLEPAELLATALRRAGPHILLVVDGEGTDPLQVARQRLTDVEVWLSAGRRHDPESVTPHVEIHPPDDVSYGVGGVTTTIRQGFLRHERTVRDRRVGVVFFDTDSTLLDARHELLTIEHEWQSIVSPAAYAAGAESAAAVCGYDMDVLQRMVSPLETTLDLIGSHDTVWFSTERGSCQGRVAALRTLQRLRPSGVAASEWRRTCTRHLDDHRAAGASGGTTRS